MEAGGYAGVLDPSQAEAGQLRSRTEPAAAAGVWGGSGKAGVEWREGAPSPPLTSSGALPPGHGSCPSPHYSPRPCSPWSGSGQAACVPPVGR